MEVLEIKSNDISSEGFQEIFSALSRNINLRQLNLEYNQLGESAYGDWQDRLTSLFELCPKFERLNISNNKIKS